MRPIRKALLGNDVTVATAAHGNCATTKIALETLLASTEGDFELILVDDCSPDDTRSLFLEIRKAHPRTRIFAFDRNLEYTNSVNSILSHASGQWVLFLSNDIFATPAYFRELFLVAGSNPRFGIVRGCSNFVDNQLPSHNIAMPAGVDTVAKVGEFAETFAEAHHGRYAIDSFLTGDAFLVSRNVLNAIGTFDQGYDGYFADHDFGIRARNAGFDLVLAKGAFAFHQASANFGYLPVDLQENKLATRWNRVLAAWEIFKEKYGLPRMQAYSSVLDIPWDELSTAGIGADQIFCPPGDYSRYLVGEQESVAGS
jgi:GT2 family glycosyltransferase